MKFIISIFFSVLLLSSCLSSQESRKIINSNETHNFFERLVSEKNALHTFVSLNITSPTYSGRVVITKYDLGFFLFKTQNLKWDESQNFIRNLLVNNETLITNSNIDSSSSDGMRRYWSFFKVCNNEYIQNYAEQGKEVFIEHFFSKTSDSTGVLKEVIDSNLNYECLSSDLINHLFNWNIFTYREGYSGELRYYISK